MNPRGALRVVMTADSVGGVWQYAIDLAEGLSHHRVATTLAVLGPAPRTDQIASTRTIPGCRLVLTGLPLDWTAQHPGEVVAAGAEIAALATRENADLVHLNSPALAENRFSAPVVGVCHSCVATWWEAAGSGPLPRDFVWRRELMARGYGAADALIAPTSAFAEATARAYVLRDAPVVVHNGRRAPQPLEFQGPEPLFVFTAGRLWDKGKNLATLDRAARRLAVPVLAAGPQRGPNGDAVALKFVRALGPLSDAEVRRRLRSRPIFVSVAHYEPFGLAVLEAAQAGCALVLSDIPSFRELWDGAAAFVPATDDEAIATAVETLAGDPVARARLGSAAWERAGRYSVEAMTAGVVSVYSAVLPGSVSREAAA
jgi:glycosyltransferase involved in cell wall biosynthesis